MRPSLVRPFALVLAFLAGCCSAQRPICGVPVEQGALRAPVSVETRYEESAVRVAAYVRMGPLPIPAIQSGSGVVVADGVLTAWHVIEGAHEVVVMGVDGKARTGTGYRRLGQLDVALVTFDRPLALPALEVTDADIETGGPYDALCVAYWGVGGEYGKPVLTQGRLFPDRRVPFFVVPHTPAPEGRWYASDIPICKGMSGGALIVHGRVVGICSFTTPHSHCSFWSRVRASDLAP